MYESPATCRIIDHLAAILYIFLSEEITQNMLAYGGTLTKEFMRLWIRHAGERRCFPTKHALLHLVECALRLGPLLFVSAFMHESNFLHLNRRDSNGMRLSAFIHNNIHHASAAKYFLHDILSQSTTFAAYDIIMQRLGSLRAQKDTVQCGAIKFMGRLPTNKITSFSRHAVVLALSAVGCHVNDATFFRHLLQTTTANLQQQRAVIYTKAVLKTRLRLMLTAASGILNTRSWLMKIVLRGYWLTESFLQSHTGRASPQ